MHYLIRILIAVYLPGVCTLLSFKARAQGIHKMWATAYTGGLNNDGTVFYVQYDGHAPLLKASMNNAGMTRPVGSLAMFSNKLYGVCRYGGAADKGSLFEFDPYSNNLVKKFDFQPANGINPESGLTLFNNILYGLCFYGGNSNQGVLYAYDPSTDLYAKKKDLDITTGYWPAGEMLVVGNRLYGVTSRGGLHDAGVIFDYDPAANVFTVRASFNGSNGLSPCGNLVYYNNMIYGTTLNAGAYGKGTIWQFNPATNALTALHQFNDAAQPQNGLTIHNGILYGVTKRGGVDNSGIFYSFDLASNTYTRIIEFSGLRGVYPTGITQYQNKLYILSNDLGSLNGGTVLEYDPASASWSKKADLDHNASGAHPSFVNPSLMQAETSPAVPGTCTNMQAVTIHAGNANQWVPITDDKGNAVAEIKANGNILGTVQTSVYIHSGTSREDRMHNIYLDRNITINAQFPPASPVDLRLYIRGTEYDKLRSATGSTGLGSGVTSINDVGIYRNDDPCGAKLFFTAPNIINAGSSWAREDYVLSTSVSSLSSFYFAGNLLELLPTRFTGFDAYEKNKTVTLIWSASEDASTYSYTIERSIDGKNFTTLSTVDAKGYGEQQYKFVDAVPLPANYYRIQFQSRDGHRGYSALKKVTVSGQSLDITVSETTANGVRLHIYSPFSQQVNCNIYNASGQLLFRQPLQLQKGFQQQELTVPGRTAGVCHMVVQGPQERKHLTFFRK